MARARVDDTNDGATSTEPPATAWAFVGERDDDGRAMRFLRDVPARDLDADEVAALGESRRERAMASGLYRPAEKVSE